MTHKSTFTRKEIQEIKRLIAEKLCAKPDKQKAIRDKIRKIGFYYSDFGTRKDGYTVEDLETLIRSGRVKVAGDDDISPAEANHIPPTSLRHQIAEFEEICPKKDEQYVLELCDKVLGRLSSRQHKFDFLLGDPNTNGFAAKLPVDGYYADLNLVIEYRERQHTEGVSFFDKPDRMTVSGVHRGEQRRIYDERRHQVLPEHGIRLVELSYSDFNYDNQKRIIRNPKNDEEVVRKKLQGYLDRI